MIKVENLGDYSKLLIFSNEKIGTRDLITYPKKLATLLLEAKFL